MDLWPSHTSACHLRSYCELFTDKKRSLYCHMDYLNPDMGELLHPSYIKWDEITYPFPIHDGAVKHLLEFRNV